MKVDLPEELEELRAGEAKGKPRFGKAVVKSFREKVKLLESMMDERDLRNWRSLRYEKLAGDREGQRSIRLNDQWRLIFTLNEATTPPTINVIEIEDYH